MLIFEEYFQDNRHKWSTKDSDDCYLAIDSNYYTFEHKRAVNNCWLAWQSLEYFYDKSEFHVHVVLEHVMSNVNHGFGFVWGLSDAYDRFEFVISKNGYYRIAKVENGKLNAFVDWKACAEIRYSTGLNVLEMRRSGESIDFYINSTIVETLSADSLTQVFDRKFGFIVYNKQKIRVHSLTIAIANAENKNYKSNKSEPRATEASFLEHEPPADDTLDKVLEELRSLVGLDYAKQQLLFLSNFLKVQTERKSRGLIVAETSLHLVLSGPPGTGKTTLARLIGRLYKQLGYLDRGHVVETDRAGIVGGYLGQTALRVDDAVKQAIDGVLFIDEAYALAPKDGVSYDFGHEALQTLLKRMEDRRDRLAVIVAGYTEEMNYFMASNPGLKSRFSRIFDFDHYTPNELVSIFNKFCQDNGYTLSFSARVELQKIFADAYSNRNKQFGNGRFVRIIFERTIEQQANRIVNRIGSLDDSELASIALEDLKQTDFSS
ncbi:MAG: AAA family ATPase [Hydrococcus sp. Prado102]|jgi:SpoVK/Ycf46/Vps4 family AAA+-type ATPase|nr:AAA family ATPase [Hydrococcus sp. Prado102]